MGQLLLNCTKLDLSICMCGSGGGIDPGMGPNLLRIGGNFAASYSTEPLVNTASHSYCGGGAVHLRLKARFSDGGLAFSTPLSRCWLIKTRMTFRGRTVLCGNCCFVLGNSNAFRGNFHPSSRVPLILITRISQSRTHPLVGTVPFFNAPIIATLEELVFFLVDLLLLMQVSAASALHEVT